MYLLPASFFNSVKPLRRICQFFPLRLSTPADPGCQIAATYSLSADTMLHSDQRCHYTSYKFIQIVKDASLRQSMSRKGNCWDNAPQESFYGHMKDELAPESKEWKTFADVRKSIDNWMDYYNKDRCQWQLAKLSPDEFYLYVTTGVYPLPVIQPTVTEGGSAP
jgi:transposase InsO family protein